MYRTLVTSTVIKRCNGNIAIEMTPKEYEDLKTYCEVCDFILTKIKLFRFTHINPTLAEPKLIKDEMIKGFRITDQIIQENSMWKNIKDVMVGELNERTR